MNEKTILLWSNGMSLRAIAEVYGVSYATVRRFLNNNGVNTGERLPSKKTAEEITAIESKVDELIRSMVP